MTLSSDKNSNLSSFYALEATPVYDQKEEEEIERQIVSVIDIKLSCHRSPNTARIRERLSLSHRNEMCMTEISHEA
jgi:hypothetical protein